MAVVAILLGLLLPTLRYVRYSANSAICGTNLRQIGIGWRQYVDEHRRLPYRGADADWRYGGAAFVGSERRAVLASDRPVNAYIVADAATDNDRIAQLFRSPLDRGFAWTDAAGPRAGQPVYPEATAFERFGTSYRANPLLLDACRLDPARPPEPLGEHEIVTSPSRMLLVAVPQWQIAVDGEPRIDASWHPEPDVGNMLLLDGSVRVSNFRIEKGRGFDYVPAPIDGPRPIVGTPALPPAF